MAGRLIASLLLLLGLGIMAGGGVLLYRTADTAGPVALGHAVGAGGAAPGNAELAATIAALDATPGADLAAARMFLHEAAAQAAPNRLEWRRHLLLAVTAARQALTASPTRAEVALKLAEIEWTLFGPGDWADLPLRLSFLTAPRELWIVNRRIGLDLSLVAAAPAELQAHIAMDIRILGEPFQDTGNYRRLARAAFLAGPPAIAVVRRELSAGHPWPLGFFEQYLAEAAGAGQASPGGGR
jgi:hypothetical protein